MIYGANILWNIDETQQILLGGVREQGKVEDGASKDVWLQLETGFSLTWA